ncbi:MAG TPA: hypothetical protein VNE84_00785 [Candidatus Limnocylindria bacterium]|jgi:hypothetical protein|nr:hypothetical protein [Candidatus Limnocylindria bacterium]
MMQKLILIFGISILAVGAAEAQDPAKVDSAHYKVILDNQHVRVLECSSQAG